MSSTTSYSPTLPGSSAAASPSGGVVISGATSGLGRALAERFVQAGWRVGAAGRDASALDSLRLAAPSDMATMQIDVCDPDAPVLLRQLTDAIGGMDIYLHCPGILVDNDDLDPDIETRMAMTNSVGFAGMISAAFRYFRDSGRSGRIVAIIFGLQGIRTGLPRSSAPEGRPHATAAEDHRHPAGLDTNPASQPGTILYAGDGSRIRGGQDIPCRSPRPEISHSRLALENPYDTRAADPLLSMATPAHTFLARPTINP